MDKLPQGKTHVNKSFLSLHHTEVQNKPLTTTLLTITCSMDCKFHSKIINLQSKPILCSLPWQYIPQGHFTQGVMGEA